MGGKRKKERSYGFAMGALMMTAAGMIAKAIGALYRIPLTNLLGAEGIGRYQLVFPLFALVISLTSGGLPAAMSRWVANRCAKGSFTAVRDAIRGGTLYALAAGLIGGVLLTSIAYPLSLLQGNVSLVWCYLLLAPVTLIVALSGAVKGWLLGIGKAWLSGWSQVLEQVVKAISGWTLASYMMRRGVAYGVLGALIGVAAAELVGLIFCVAAGVANRKTLPPLAADTPRVGAKEGAIGIAGMVLPIAAGGLVFPLSSFADSLLIVPLLGVSGLAHAGATAQYGILTGSINTLINLPAAVVLALGVCIIPAVGGLLACGDVGGIRDKTAGCLVLGTGIGAPCAAAFFVLARPLVQAFYPGLDAQIDLAVDLMRLSCVNALFLGQLELYNAILQGMGKARRAALGCAIAAGAKLLIEAVTIPLIGIWGACVAGIVMYAGAFALNAGYYRQMTGKNPFLLQNNSKILLASVIMGIVVAGIVRYIAAPWKALAVCVPIGTAVYALILWLAGVLRDVPRALIDRPHDKTTEE